MYNTEVRVHQQGGGEWLYEVLEDGEVMFAGFCETEEEAYEEAYEMVDGGQANECGSCGGSGWVDDRYRGAGVTCRSCNGTGRERGEDDFHEPEEPDYTDADMDAAADRYFAY
jgi:hypothetical protein